MEKMQAIFWDYSCIVRQKTVTGFNAVYKQTNEQISE
jgi:hypothetical protein